VEFPTTLELWVNLKTAPSRWPANSRLPSPQAMAERRQVTVRRAPRQASASPFSASKSGRPLDAGFREQLPQPTAIDYAR